ncbi:hypothetical protein BVF97_30340 [Bacillus thuringiensis]|uniref:Uncharacterized protein n=1 Tax=Bacillus thuringiensis TaxID=1428 RepID=A0ABD6QZQ7_BACTU|nr:hypothetical protein BVF97_30340 [Bacillus thuringiensis]
MQKEKNTRRHLNKISKYLNNITEQIIVLLRNGILPKLPPNKYTFLPMIDRKYRYMYFYDKKRIANSQSFKVRVVDLLELELLTLVMGVLIQIILDVFQLLSTFLKKFVMLSLNHHKTASPHNGYLQLSPHPD